MLRCLGSLRGAANSQQVIRRVKHFSSDSSPGIFESTRGYVNRCIQRTDQMERYREHSMFPPDNSWLHNYLLYAQLQLPAKTEIDAVEFLNGARFACEQVMTNLYSAEFLDYAGAISKATEGAETVSKPPVAEEMEAMFEPVFYHYQLLRHAARLRLRYSHIEFQKLDFTGVYLSGVKCQRLTVADLKREQTTGAVIGESVTGLQLKLRDEKNRAEVNAWDVLGELSSVGKKVEKKLAVNPEDETTKVERLQLKALFNIEQSVETISVDNVKHVVTESQVACRMRFVSLVTEPEDVDWRIDRMNQTGRVLSRTAKE
ncbi:hypothetical protein BBO99_00001996 [Phytophthora kernoviae]|uniref:Uncharacterized protein n=2 Tax=Phytophthora kernoviae TaxID=325452 RepID=A0A3R7JCX4_9STRA|nr:hypothetical protein G195_000873 [Phytophthora kernoviae 00238/432]KAG2532845.1 hypothetical protein JM16_000001 [Phytophthora kernoviae]KAG2533556.1 hypothetical protein JM18_000001 [Phytophthora kernoviae]RLN11093.1 hypothetical protein BBI17_000217 [Phytophthora kernoviae]RLN86178.1 hypothetical protein BBO99_00001996 [Phytophthora kernoviae]